MKEEEEEMENKCNKCKELEEHVYRNHYASGKAHFFHLLNCSISERLRIPREFVLKYGGKIGNSVKLKAPNGRVWNVALEKTKCGDAFFHNGWKNFSQDNNLEANDFLAFEYDGDSSFLASVFHKGECKMKRFVHQKIREKIDESVEILHVPKKKKKKVVICLSSETQTNGAKKAFQATQAASSESESNFASWRRDGNEGDRSDEDSTTARHSRGEPSCKGKSKSHSKAGSVKRFVSNRRAVTMEEKQRVLASAYAYQASKPNFLTVMKPSNVHRLFYLTVPCKFVNEHIPQGKKTIILTIPEGNKKWQVTFGCRKYSASLQAGWWRFVQDNNLEEDDVCVFTLEASSPNTEMEVRIFRVVDEVVPLKVSHVRTSN